MSYPLAFAIALALLIGPQSASAKPVALFVNFGDSGHLDGEMKRTAERARGTFKKLDYDFTLLEPGADLPKRIEAALSAIAAKKPEELIILTHGHGEIVDPLPDERRFPLIRSRPGPYVSDPLAFVFMNGRANDAGHTGAGDFRDWFLAFRRASPATPIRMIIAECYSGAAARVLNEIPGVKVYASASDHEKASLRKNAKGNKLAFVDFYLDELEKGAERDALELFEASRARWMAFSASEKEKLAEVPWSPLDARINSWCERHSETERGVSPQLTPELDRLKALSFATIKYEEGAGRIWRTLSKCEAPKLRLHQEGLALAIRQWAAIARIFQARLANVTREDIARVAKERRDRGSHEPDLEEILRQAQMPQGLENFKRDAIEKFALSVDCYRTRQSLACGRGTKPTALAAIIGGDNMQEPDRMRKACAFETDVLIAPCLIAAGEIAEEQPGLAAERVRRILNRTIDFAIEACSGQRADYYRSCYERFWSQADEGTLSELQK